MYKNAATKTSHFSPQLLLASGPCCGAPDFFSRFEEAHGKSGENPIPGQPEKLRPFFLMEKMGKIFTCRFFVTFLGWRKTWPFQRLSDLQRLGIKKVTAWITCYPLEEKVRGKKNCNTKTNLLRSPWNQFSIDPRPWRFFFQKSCGWDWWEKLSFNILSVLGSKASIKLLFDFRFHFCFFVTRQCPQFLGGVCFCGGRVSTQSLSPNISRFISQQVFEY